MGGLGTVSLGQNSVGDFQPAIFVAPTGDAGAAPTVKLSRGVLGDHLFVALGEAKVVSVAVGLRRRGNNPDL